MIQRASKFMGNDPVHAWRRGMTLSARDNSLMLYATDNVSMIEAEVSTQSEADTDTILPGRFVKILLDTVKRTDLDLLEVGEGWVMAKFADETVVCAQTDIEVNLDGYESIFVKCEDEVEDYFLVSEDVLKAAGNAASILSVIQEDHLKLDLQESDLTFTAGESNRAESKEKVSIKHKNHPDISVWATGKELLRLLEEDASMSIIPQAVVVRGDGFMALLSTGSDD